MIQAKEAKRLSDEKHELSQTVIDVIESLKPKILEATKKGDYSIVISKDSSSASIGVLFKEELIGDIDRFLSEHGYHISRYSGYLRGQYYNCIDLSWRYS